MNEEQITSWIFLAIALASQTEPTDIKGISMVADGINHAVPTQKELQNSISWLSRNNLIVKSANKYKLTILGEAIIKKAAGNKETLLKIWKNLELEIKNLHTEYLKS